MRTYRVLVVMLLAALVGVYAGCSDDNPVNPDQMTLDQQAIADLVNNSNYFEHDVLSHTVPDTNATVGARAAAEERFFWWREYTAANRELTVDVHAADSAHADAWADVTVTTTFSGVLHIVHRDTAGAFTHNTKALTDVFTQTAGFEQQLSETAPNRGWVQTQMSNIVGGSVPTTLSISNLNIDAAQSPDRLYTEQSFQAPYAPAEKLTLASAESVNLWVLSDAATNRVFRHDWYSGGATRQELINMDLGYYAQQLTTSTALTTADSERHLAIDVIAPGVIDGVAPYDALIWAVPYELEIAAGQ